MSVLLAATAHAGNNGGDGLGVGVGVGVGLGVGSANASAKSSSTSGALSGTVNSGNSTNKNNNVAGVDNSGNSVNVIDANSTNKNNVANVNDVSNRVSVSDGDVSNVARNNVAVKDGDVVTGDVNVTIGGDGTPLTASSQSVGATTQTVEGDESVINVDARDQSVTNWQVPASTAATSFSSICTSGAAAQRTTYGISLAVTSDVCTHLMMADAWMAMGDTEKALKSVRAAGRHATWKGWFGYFRHAVTLGVL